METSDFKNINRGAYNTKEHIIFIWLLLNSKQFVNIEASLY